MLQTYHDRKANIKLIHSEELTSENVAEKLSDLDAIPCCTWIW